MRIAYAILSPLLLLGGCATSGAHGAQDQPMANCPMSSAPAAGDQHGAMMGDHSQMMGQGQMQGMRHDMANCPMMGSATPAPAPSPAPPPADPHQH